MIIPFLLCFNNYISHSWIGVKEKSAKSETDSEGFYLLDFLGFKSLVEPADNKSKGWVTENVPLLLAFILFLAFALSRKASHPFFSAPSRPHNHNPSTISLTHLSPLSLTRVFRLQAAVNHTDKPGALMQSGRYESGQGQSFDHAGWYPGWVAVLSRPLSWIFCSEVCWQCPHSFWNGRWIIDRLLFAQFL